MFHVTMTALIAGDPRKAWHGSTGPDDVGHVPDDVWQDQDHPFDALADAIAFVGTLPEPSTTHVNITDDAGLVLYHQDGGDDLDATAEGVESIWAQEARKERPPSIEEPPPPPPPEDAPPILPAQ